MKIYKMSVVTLPKWPSCPYMVKTFKNLLLQHQLTSDLVTCYVALGFQYYQDCSNDDLWLTLTVLQHVQRWENADSKDSMESFKDLA